MLLHRKNRFRTDRVLNSWAEDSVFLGVLMMLSSLLYMLRLGFYWDDWQALRIFRFSDNQSVLGLTRSLFVVWPEMKARPVQAIEWAVVYKLFAEQPLGYHVLAIGTLCFGVCVFYVTLRNCTDRRLFSLATAAVYGSLPHYSTDRLWAGVLVANLSMGLYFLSLFADLKQLSRRSWFWPWKIVSAISLIISLLAYELFMPFFLMNPVLVAIRRWTMKKMGNNVVWGRLAFASSSFTNVMLILLISIYKHRTSPRAPSLLSVLRWWPWLLDSARRASIDLTFHSYGINLPHILSTIWHKYWNWSSFWVSFTVAGLVAWYLIRAAKLPDEVLPRGPYLVMLVIAGTLISGMSYSYLYDYYQVNTGGYNRATIAAASMVAITWVSLAALFSLFLSLLGHFIVRRADVKPIFAVVIALMCGCGCLVNNTIASFFVEASQRQHEVLTDLKEHFHSLPVGSTVLLMGLCAWTGPAPIFQETYDLGGALALLYKDPTIKGELLRPWQEVHETGILSGPDINNEHGLYLFDSIYIYDVRRKESARIPDANTGLGYVARAKEEDLKEHQCTTAGFNTGLVIW
jgi:hypothetical protein